MQRKPNEQFIQAYSEEFSEKVALDYFDKNETISGKQIINVSPSKQVNFFILKNLFKKWQEEMKQLESPYFNYKNNEVRRAMVQFMNTLSQHIEMGEPELQDLMKQAVIETIMISTAPIQYLQNELEEKQFDALNEKIYKPYLKYLRIRKEEFQAFFVSALGISYDALVERAKEELNTDVIEEEIIKLNEIIPISIDEIFYEEDENDIIQPVIEEEDLDLPSFEQPESSSDLETTMQVDDSDADGNQTSSNQHEENHSEKSMVEPDTALEVSESSQKEDIDSSSYEERPEELIAEPQANSDEKSELSQAANNELAIEEETGSQHTDSVEEEELIEEDLLQEETPVVTSEEEAKPETATLNDQYQEEEVTTLAEQHTQKKVESILDAISVNHRYMFTKELFDGDRDEFQKAIANIETAESFDAAVELIVQTYAKKLDWDMNSDEVKELLKVVFRKFR